MAGMAMTAWENENLDYFFNSRSLVITAAGPLVAPVISFKISRRKGGGLRLITSSNIDNIDSMSKVLPGTITSNHEVVEFAGDPRWGADITATAKGVVPTRYATRYNAEGKPESRQYSILNSIELISGGSKEVQYTVEWVSNVDKAASIWTGLSIDSKKESSKTVSFNTSSGHITLSRGYSGKSFSSAGTKISIDGIDVYLCAFSKRRGNKKSDCIIYSGDIDGEKRRKIREILSFCLGKMIYYKGYVKLDRDCNTVAIEVRSIEDIAKHATKIPRLPPAPLFVRYENEVDHRVLEKMAGSIYSKYDDLNFQELSWSYWHAACAPVHMAAAHYGAALEALRRVCISNKKISATLIEKDAWQEVRTKLIAVICETSVPESIKSVITKKVDGLNYRPTDHVFEEVLSELGLEIGPLEKKAWKRRNQAAHGASLSSKDYVSLIRDTKILKILMHRIILSFTNSSNFYYDYYTLGFPIRNLRSAIPLEAQDKNIEDNKSV